MANPYGLAFDPSGRLLIADGDGGRVLRLDPQSNAISLVAGTGQTGTSGEGGPASGAQITFPVAVVAAAGGNVYIADVDGFRILQVNPAGTLTRILGTGKRGAGGAVGKPTEIDVGFVYGLAIESSGALLFLEENRLRRLDPSGAITTVAGSGAKGQGGEGGPAAAAELNEPHGLAVDRTGNIFIADTSAARIVRIDHASGVLSRVAGTGGTSGFSGDGGPAAAAMLNRPRQLFVTDAGAVVFADEGNDRVRRIAADGTISTIAGSGAADFSGDGGPATAAGLRSVWGVALAANGDLFVASPPAHAVRKIDAKTGVIGTVPN